MVGKRKKTKRPKAVAASGKIAASVAPRGGGGGGGGVGREDFNVGTHTAKRASTRARKRG